jgi:hypothetical protein
MAPRHLLINDTAYILKESSRLLLVEEGGTVALETREAGMAGGLVERMQRWSLDELCWAIPEIPRKRLWDYREEKREPNQQHRALIVAGLVTLESGERPPTWEETWPRLERSGVKIVAARLGMRAGNLRRYLTGPCVPGREMLYSIAAVLDELDAAEAASRGAEGRRTELGRGRPPLLRP